MRVLLIWPVFKTQGKSGAPPLGLLKIAGYHRAQGDDVSLVRSVMPLLARETRPDKVYVSSLFTYDREPVIRQVHACWSAWPGVEVHVGGIWASLMPDDVRYSTGAQVHVGLLPWAEDVRPAWDLWPGDTSVVFASRGCIRQCLWCCVAQHDGPGFRPKAIDLVLDQLDLERPKVELWDSNILAHPDFAELAERLVELDKRVKIEQGLDARLVTRQNVALVRRLRVREVCLAYDQPGQKEAVERAIRYLREAGQSEGHIIVYMLYNFFDPVMGWGDTPRDIYQRIDDVLGWGARVYPMRYRPVNSSNKQFISPLWGWDELRRFNKARGNMSRGSGVVHRSLREYVGWGNDGFRERQAACL